MRRVQIILLIFSISSVLSLRLKYRASVQENVDLYHTITSLDQMLSVNYRQSIEFLNVNSPYTTYFLVDGQKLRTSRLIDREEFCRIKLCENSLCHPCEINMDFVLKENGQPRDIISLVLTIEDVNEFRPQFSDSSRNDQALQLNISEGVPVGHILPIPSATDQDGEDDELIYWLDRSTRVPFELISFGSNQIALNVTEPLDRETQDVYNLQLTASDRGNLTTSVPLHIYISDINDNVPVFTRQTPYILNISENTIPSSAKSLLRIHAIDNDSNENGRVTYSFSPQVPEFIRRTFQLNSQTGDLFLRQSVDYEQYKEYRIPITAQDSGPVSVPVYTMIIIYVEDENDHKPIMTLRISDYYQFINNTLYISEETPVNTLLMHVLAQDFDANLNGKVRCWIESSDPLALNVTNTINNMFSIYTSQLFDREQQESYKFRLIIEDSGLKIQHRTVRDLQLIITDINDSPPKFTQLLYNLSLREEEDYHQAIIQFQASDADSKENSEVSYTLVANTYPEFFSLDEKTGALFLQKRLNRELQSEYNLTIRACDHGKYPSQLHSDVLCYIKVLDRNEFKPEFAKEKYVFNQVKETIAVNTSIGFLQASDQDGNSVIYSISSSNFRINSTTGELVVNKALDYDRNQSCEVFSATVRDEQGWNSICQVEICLQPVNEYVPEIRSESRLIYINLDNTSSIDLIASDRDYSPSSFLSFHFQPIPKCNFTFSSNGTIYIHKQDDCQGLIDLHISIDDNDQHPSSKISNETIRLILYSNTRTLAQILSASNYTYTIGILIISIIIISISMIICLVLRIFHREHTKESLNKSTPLKMIKEQLGFTENHCLLNEGLIDMKNIKLNTHAPSDTSSSSTDSCYGSSEMDVYHHQAGNRITSTILSSSNDKYIILCKDQNNDDIHSSSSSSSSPTGNNINLITRYQEKKRTGMVQKQYLTELQSTVSQNVDFFQSDYEYKRVLGSTTTFNCRNITPLNEYYL